MNSTNTMSNMSNTNPPTARRRSSFQQFERRCSLASLPEDELLELDDDGSMHSVPNVDHTARRRSSGNADFLALGGFSSSAGLSLSLGEFDSDARLNYGHDAGGPPVVDLPRDFRLDAPSSSSFNSSGAAVVFAKGDDGSDVSETDNILNRALHDDGNANHRSSSNNNIMSNDNSNSSLLNSSRSSFKPCKIKRRHSSNRNAKRRGSLNSSNSTAGGASHRSSSHRSSYSHRSSHSTRSSQHSQLTMRSHQTSHSWKFGEWEYSSHVNCSANSTYSGHSYCSDGLSSLYQVLDMGDGESADYESGGSAVDLSDFYEDADGGMGIGVDTSDANLGGNETTNKSSNANDGTDGEDGAKTRGTAKVTTAGKKGLECATKTTADNFTASAFHNFHRKSSCGSNDTSCNSQSCEDNCDEKSTTLQDNIMSKATMSTKTTTDKFAVTTKASEPLAPKTLELKKSNSTGSTTFPSSSFKEHPLQPSSPPSSKAYIRAASAGSATLRSEAQPLTALTLQTQPSRSTFTAGMTTASTTTYAAAAATGIKRRTIQETLRKDEESFAASLASLRLSNGMPRKQTDGVEGAEEVTLGMGFGAGDTMFGEEWEREQWSLEEKNQTLVGTEMLMPNPQRQRRKQLQTEGMVDGNGRMSSDGTIATATTTFPEYSNRDDFKARLDVRT